MVCSWDVVGHIAQADRASAGNSLQRGGRHRGSHKLSAFAEELGGGDVRNGAKCSFDRVVACTFTLRDDEVRVLPAAGKRRHEPTDSNCNENCKCGKRGPDD